MELNENAIVTNNINTAGKNSALSTTTRIQNELKSATGKTFNSLNEVEQHVAQNPSALPVVKSIFATNFLNEISPPGGSWANYRKLLD